MQAWRKRIFQSQRAQGLARMNRQKLRSCAWCNSARTAFPINCEADEEFKVDEMERQTWSVKMQLHQLPVSTSVAAHESDQLGA